MVSFGGKKRWAHAQVGLRQGFHSKFSTGIPTPFIWESPGALYTNIHCLHLEQAFETLLEEMKLDTDVLDETFSLQLELVFFQAYSRLRKYNHAVLLQLYVFVKLWTNQSWVNLLFSVPQDLILHPILDSFFPILDSQFVQESRIANCIENQNSQRTVNLLLNGTVTV